MGTTTVRIDEGSRQALRSLAKQTKQSMSAVVAEALECYRRKVIMAQINADYARLREDKQAWAEELLERAEWDGVLADGLDEEP